MSRFSLLFILALQVSAALAMPLTKEKVPEPLKPWIDWVLQGKDSYQCPFFFDDFKQKQCSWPGKLDLKLKSEHAQFNSHWQVYKESWIVLPGSQNHWPQNVTINDKLALVINRQDKPSVKLYFARSRLRISNG